MAQANLQQRQQGRLDKLRNVQIEGSILLKIINHGTNPSSPDSGMLLGLQIKSILEVTNCFPDHPDASKDEEIVKLMSEIRHDNFRIGWYQISNNCNFLNESTIARHYGIQKDFENAILIIYDPISTNGGRLVIRAFRLTNSFMKFYDSNQFGPTAISSYKLTSNKIFEEFDIKIHNGNLIHAFLFEIKDNKSLNCDFDRLHNLHSKSITNNLRNLSNNIELFSNETQTFRRYYSKCSRIKNEREEYETKFIKDNESNKSRGFRLRQMPDLEKLYPSEPETDRLRSVILTAQMNELAKEVETSTMQGLAKLWVTQGIHSKNPINQ